MMDLLRRALELWISKYHDDLTMGDRVYLRTARNIAPNKLAKFRMSTRDGSPHVAPDGAGGRIKLLQMILICVKTITIMR